MSILLMTLGGVNHQQSTLASSDGAADLVREIDMSWGVNEVQYIFLTILHIFHLDGVTLNRDATLTLQIHIIQHLSFRHLDSLGELQQTVGQRRLAMVDMCDDAKVTYMVHS